MIFKDHPRSRGNHFDCVYNWDHNLGSPPLAREPHTSCAVNALACGITPARAGTTTGNFTLPKIDRDHPRSRGNHYSNLHPLGVNFGITPARAGTTPRGCNKKTAGWDHPRSRGNHIAYIPATRS